MDIMNEFLKEGQFASIPTAVFYTRDHQYIGHWIERPEAASREMAAITPQVQKEMPDPRSSSRGPPLGPETRSDTRTGKGSR